MIFKKSTTYIDRNSTATTSLEQSGLEGMGYIFFLVFK